MKQPTASALLVTLIILLILAGFQLWGQAIPAAKPSMPAAPEAALGLPSAEDLPPFSLPPVERFSETLARPLFYEARQPPDPRVANGFDPQARSESISSEDPILSAIVLSSDERFVLVKDPGKQDLRRVQKGEEVAGWSLDEIRNDSVLLRKDDRTKVVSLWQFQPPPQQPAIRRGRGTPKQTLQRRQARPHIRHRVTPNDANR